jgi:hypothetical protein
MKGLFIFLRWEVPDVISGWLECFVPRVICVPYFNLISITREPHEKKVSPTWIICRLGRDCEDRVCDSNAIRISRKLQDLKVL